MSQRIEKPTPRRPNNITTTRIFERVGSNPILAPTDLDFPAAAITNPGAIEQDGEVVLLPRVVDLSGHSSIHVARSRNGVDGWRVEREPILRYARPDCRYEQWGCEDARVVFLEPEEQYYITYTAYSSNGAAVAIARSKDLCEAERISLIFAPNNKDAVLFPQRFEGRWAVLHRPDAGNEQHIWSAFSPDLVHWGEPHCVLKSAGGAAWDGVKVGAGPPPVLTDHGWLMLYHGVKLYGGHMVYRAGAAMLERDRPHKLARRCDHWLFQSEAEYELSGFMPNVVFPTGLLLRGDELWLYYGAADTYSCLAIASLKDVLELFD
jgi:predicted GH43/DUF377 family glycosyl hydrolase